MKKRFRILALALSMLLVLSACGTSATPTPGNSGEPAPGTSAPESPAPASTKDELVVAAKTEPSSLDPHNVNMVTAFTLDYQIFDRLFTADADNNIIPQLAETWEWVDETTLRVKIHEGVKFTNGDDLTAEDVVYSIQRACESSFSAATMSNFDGPNTVAVDTYTVDIKTKSAYPNALRILTHGRASIVCKRAIEEMGDEYGRTPVGSGRLIVEKWNAGDSIQFSRNDNYWNKDAIPAFKTMTFRFISENASRAIEVETGGADIAMEVAGTDLSRLEANPDVNVLVGPGATVNQIVINSVNYPGLDNVKFREALHTALNMDAITKTAYVTADTAQSLFPPSTEGFKDVSGNTTYDPEKAKTLLAESGYDTSKELVINIAKGTEVQNAAEMVANMWTAIGLNVRVEIIENATLTTNNAKGETPICITTNTTSAGNPENLLLMWEKSAAGWTSDADLVGRIQAAKAIVDDNERAAAYGELQEELWNLHTVIPICVSQVAYASRSNVQGLECHPSKQPDFSKVYFG